MTIDTNHVKRLAAEVGFDGCGVARAERLGDEEFPLEAWIAEGGAAELGYMREHAEMRRDPQRLVEGARSVVSVFRGYNPDVPTVAGGGVRIARYAYQTDYHQTIKRMLYELVARLREVYPNFEAKACCDTAPISDKHWAARAGLGWIGRQTLLITPTWGSWVNLGELVTTAECTEYDSPMEEDRCVGCRRCVDACPNQALRMGEDGRTTFDARACTAYHTIESHSPTLPAGLKTRGYVFGCDICQLACPYNVQVERREVERECLERIEALPQADESAFKKLVKNSAMSRIRYAQWRRNVEGGKQQKL